MIDSPREKLEALQKDLVSAIQLASESSQPVELDQANAGRVSRGDALQQQAMAKAGLQRDRQRLVEVAKAFTRLEEGDYGYCIECGEGISDARLTAMPEVALCVSCQGKAE